LDSLGESPFGAGGRISYYPRPWLAADIEANHFFQDSSGNFGHTEFLAGARAGSWLGPVGLFAKVRPGWFHLGGGTAQRNPGREDHAALDLGAVILLGRGRIGARIDAGDTLIFWGDEPFLIGTPRALNPHNRQVSIGLVFRF
jgi:hypothetical protein